MHDVATLVIKVEAENPHAALASVDAILETTLESLSYQFQQMLRYHEVEVIDVTPPAEVGEPREVLILPAPNGLPTRSFIPSMNPLGITTALYPDPTLQINQGDPKVSRAIDWFLKGIRADLQADQFMFFWIATEILGGDSGISIREPIVTWCNHTIRERPECGKPTDRELQGESRQAFLCETFELSGDDARTIWRLRQMMHGAVAFDSTLMEQLPQKCYQLWQGLVSALNDRLGFTDHLPRLDGNNVMVSPGIGIAGSRELQEWHLED